MTNIIILLALIYVATKGLKLLLFKKARKGSIICKCGKLITSKIHRKLDKALRYEAALNKPNVVEFKQAKKRARG